MGDLISKRAAIDALKVAYWDKEMQSATDDPCIVDAMTDWAIRTIRELPSAEPEQKKGEWINRSLNILYPEWERYTCSVCGKHSYCYDFCPNCGSYNVGEQDE